MTIFVICSTFNILIFLSIAKSSNGFLQPHEHIPLSAVPPSSSATFGKKQVIEQKKQKRFGLHLSGKNVDSLNTNKIAYDRRSIYIGNVDWKIPPEVITMTLMQLFNDSPKHDDERKKIGIKKEQIEVKLITSNKKRDRGKMHGGSLSISFDSENDAYLAMETLMKNQQQGEAQKQKSLYLLNSKGEIKVRWGLVNYKKQSKNISENVRLLKNDLQDEKLLQHRQRRALKYKRQRQRIANKTDLIIHSLKHILPPESISFMNNFDELQLVRPLTSISMLCTSPSSISSLSHYIDWSKVPTEIDPTRGGKINSNSLRGRRKQAQVEAFVYVLLNALLADDIEKCSQNDLNNIRVADLGCGAGNLSIPMAWILKQELGNNVKVVAVDINQHALSRLEKRSTSIGLQNNVETVEEDLLRLISIDYEYNKSDDDDEDDERKEGNNQLLESCSVVVSLHACGAASDLAIAAAVGHSLPFAVSPCCIGKVKSIRNLSNMPSLAKERASIPNCGIISYPRSEAVMSCFLTENYHDDSTSEKLCIDDYSLILTAADYSSTGDKNESDQLTDEQKAHERRGRLSKLIVETDRLVWAEEHGYIIRMMQIPQLGNSYPKKELLLGAKKGTLAAEEISRL